MSKIFAYVGSGAGEKSHTLQYVRQILSAAAALERSVEYEIFTPADVKIDGCKSCNACFFDGKCRLDQTDDMQLLKQLMLEADFIIWGSPVFAHHVSSDTKSLIDRVSYWIKAFALGGKLGMAVSTTSNNGHNTVIRYLEEIMNCLGVYVVAADNVALHVPDEFYNEAVMKEKTERYSQMIVEYLSGQKEIPFDPILSRHFSNCKREARLSQLTGTFHYPFWVEKGFYECESYAEMMRKKGERGREA